MRKAAERSGRPWRNIFLWSTITITLTLTLTITRTTGTKLAFSIPPRGGSAERSRRRSSSSFWNQKTSLTGTAAALDRFQATCPADTNAISQFDSQLVFDDNDPGNKGSVWVAVYRSQQESQPSSIFIRDEFFQAMNAATSSSSTTTTSSSSSSWVGKLVLPTPLASSAKTPVAVAQLRPSHDQEETTRPIPHTWVMDTLRCALPKETLDVNCDGGSEFLEALGVGIDALVLYHLKYTLGLQHNDYADEDADDESRLSVFPHTKVPFEGAIRTKATLFSHRLLEERGFRPVERLSKDMATHVSSLDGCLARYASRSVDTRLCWGARDVALQIVSILSSTTITQVACPPEANGGVADANDDDGNNADKRDEYDPWANIKMQI